MNPENQTPRGWLLARHQRVVPQLDARRREALATTARQPARSAGWFPLSPAKWLGALASAAAVLVIGTVVYQTSVQPEPAPSLDGSSRERAEPQPAPSAAKYDASAAPTDKDAGFVGRSSPAPGVAAPQFPHRTRAQIVEAANQPGGQVDRTLAPPTLVESTVPSPRGSGSEPAPVNVAGQSPGARSLYPSDLFSSRDPLKNDEPVPAASKPGWKPVTAWTNAGKATAAATMETWLWADVNRRTDVWLSTVVLTDVGREKIIAYHQALPATERARFPSAFDMYAQMAMGMHELSWNGMSVLKQTARGPGAVDLSVEWEWSDGRARETTRSFNLYGDEWKMPQTDDAVQGVLNFYRNRPLPGSPPSQPGQPPRPFKRGS
jgi:hypothetical protein